MPTESMLYLGSLSGQFGPWLSGAGLSTPMRRNKRARYQTLSPKTVFFGGKRRRATGQYLSELVSHEEGRGIGFRLHVSHMGRSGGIDMVGRKHLQWNQTHRASYFWEMKTRVIIPLSTGKLRTMQMNVTSRTTTVSKLGIQMTTLPATIALNK